MMHGPINIRFTLYNYPPKFRKYYIVCLFKANVVGLTENNGPKMIRKNARGLKLSLSLQRAFCSLFN